MTIAVMTRLEELQAAALRIRHHILDMGEVQGQGYVGQGLGVSDVLAVVYKDLATLRPEDPHWDGRDRVLLSMGHYAIALYAALAEAGVLDVAELETYGSDESRLPMSGMSTYTRAWRSPAARWATAWASASGWRSGCGCAATAPA
jgi:transketolase